MNSSLRSVGAFLLASTLVDAGQLNAQSRMSMMARTMGGPGNAGMSGMSGPSMPPVAMPSPGMTNNMGRRRFGTLNPAFSFNYPFANRMAGLSMGYSPGLSGIGYLPGQYGNPYPPVNAAPAARANNGDAGDPPAVREQKTALLKEQVERERLDNRRKMLEHQNYERESVRREELTRRFDHPTTAEILSGQSLNELLEAFRTLGVDIDSPEAINARVPLDRNGLQHINVTHGFGSIALLKRDGCLTWPIVLTSPEFQIPRERLNVQAREVTKRAQSSSVVDLATIRRMNGDLDQIEILLRRSAGELSFEPFIEAKHFVQSLREALVALQQPDAANLLTGNSPLQVQTVLGLIKQMNDGGWRFAPALPGDEAAYLALRDAMGAVIQLEKRRVCDRAGAARTP